MGLAAAAGSVVVYAILALSGDLRQNLPVFLGGWAALAGLYLMGLVALRRTRPTRAALAFVLAAGALFRAELLLARPSLSDDVHRYVRDGWVQVHGINPYAAAPDDPALASLRLPDHALINNPSIPTIYPPGAQALFAAAAFVRPSPAFFKVLFVLFDLAAMLFLAGWLRRRGRNPLGVAVYAWHPLAVVEVAGSGHVDGVGAFLLALAIVAIIGGRKIASSVALGAAMAVKIVPVLAVPFFVRRWNALHIAVCAGLLVLAAAPYARSSQGRFFEGFGEYATRWEFNGALYPLIEEGIDRLQPQEALRSTAARVRRLVNDEAGWLVPPDRWLESPRLARIVAALAFAACLLAIALRNSAPEREVFAGLGAALLLSPTVHPWYLLWILPLLVLLGAGPRMRNPGPGHPRRSIPGPSHPLAWSGTAWLWLTLAVPLSYLAYASAGSVVPVWVRGAEYLPMIPLALWERAAGKRGWFSEETP